MFNAVTKYKCYLNPARGVGESILEQMEVSRWKIRTMGVLAAMGWGAASLRHSGG